MGFEKELGTVYNPLLLFYTNRLTDLFIGEAPPSFDFHEANLRFLHNDDINLTIPTVEVPFYRLISITAKIVERDFLSDSPFEAR